VDAWVRLADRGGAATGLLGNPVGWYVDESAIEMGAVKVDEHEPLVEA
jgi:hypothetical protein